MLPDLSRERQREQWREYAYVQRARQQGYEADRARIHHSPASSAPTAMSVSPANTRVHRPARLAMMLMKPFIVRSILGAPWVVTGTPGCRTTVTTLGMLYPLGYLLA